jgi:hypothetical protein
MQGIGNPMYADPRLQTEQGIGNMTIGEVVSVVAETVVDMVKDPLAQNVDVGPPVRNSSMPGYGSGGAVSHLCVFASLLVNLGTHKSIIFMLVIAILETSAWTQSVDASDRRTVDDGL